MKAKICHAPNCNRLIPQTEKYCNEHTPAKRAPFQNAVRYNEKLYNTTAWRQLRKIILKDNPICSKCGSEKSLEIHHIKSPRGNENLFFDESNLMVVCVDCHRKITAYEIRSKTLK